MEVSGRSHPLLGRANKRCNEPQGRGISYCPQMLVLLIEGPIDLLAADPIWPVPSPRLWLELENFSIHGQSILGSVRESPHALVEPSYRVAPLAGGIGVDPQLGRGPLSHTSAMITIMFPEGAKMLALSWC